MPAKKIGIIGYGFIGSTLYKRIKQERSDVDVSWIYNRSPNALADAPKEKILRSLDDYRQYSVDLIVEVAHPNITDLYAARFLEGSDYMPVSLTD